MIRATVIQRMFRSVFGMRGQGPEQRIHNEAKHIVAIHTMMDKRLNIDRKAKGEIAHFLKAVYPKRELNSCSW